MDKTILFNNDNRGNLYYRKFIRQEIILSSINKRWRLRIIISFKHRKPYFVYNPKKIKTSMKNIKDVRGIIKK